MDIPPADLAHVRDLYSRGRYRQALAAADAFGPLRTWTATPARLTAGRLAMQLGAPRLGRRLHAAAYRASPAYPEAVYYHARYRFERFGPYACRRFARLHPDWSEASPDVRADWLALLGFAAARLRDFDRAEKYLNQAEAIAPHRPWIAVERAAAYEAADRPADALAAALRALELQPFFRPAVQAVAHLHARRGDDAAAAAVLIDADAHLESGIVAAQLAAVQLDLGRFADARRSLDRYEDLSPLLEPDGAKWLAARRADVAYALGETSLAAGHARTVGDDFYSAFADALDAGDTGRVLLPITPGRGGPHDLLAEFWNEPLPVPPADAPAPPDGLPDAADRRRAEAAGWAAREFTLTPDAAFEEIHAGRPFILSLVEVGVTQTRLVIGADRVRQSLFLADAHDRKPVEAPIAVLMSRYAPFGPRCLTLVPARFAEALPASDADADAVYEIQKLLLDRKFADAKTAIDAVTAAAPAGRVAKVAANAWARATAHPQLLLEATVARLADFPHEPTFVLTHAAALRDLGRLPERRAVLEAEGYGPNADPLLAQSLAQMLLADPREQAAADRLLRRSLRVRPQAAAGYYLLASQQWEQQNFTAAADLYRTAYNLDDREEQFADAYFRVAKTTGQAPDALRLFQQKATRPARPHPPAVKALFNALIDRDEPDQAFGMLATAIDKLTAADPPHADLAELLLFRAEANAQFGKPDAADADLHAARPFAPGALWHKAAAKLARLRPDPSATLEHLKAALAIEPAWADGHRLVCGLLAETDGPAAARAHATATAVRFPYSYPLLRLRAELAAPGGDDAAAHAARSLVTACPTDAWAHRQLALVYADRKRDADALAAAARAGELEPTHPSYFAVLAHVHRRGNRIPDALDAYRAAVRADVDHDLAVTELVQLSRGRKEKRAALKFVAAELARQPHAGEGLVAFRDQSLSVAADGSDDEDQVERFEKVLDDLQTVLDARPDLWQAWSVVIQQLGFLQRLDEARELAVDATERFPLLAQLWADLARVAAAQGRSDDRIDALRSAVSAAPGWAPAARDLADALAEAGEDAEAVAVLERAAARSPTDATAHAALADQLWQAGRAEDALDRAKLAVRHDPGFDAAWGMVSHWGDRLDRPDEAVRLARDLTQDRPGDLACWLKLARLLHDPNPAAEALAALDKVIELDPRNVEAHDLKAERLAEVGRYDDALTAARPPELAADLPLILQGRAAWVEAKRGNYPAAISPMQALVSLEPNYYWGWQQLAEWYSDTGRNEQFFEAAAQLVRLKPDHPIPLTLRGEARLKTGDRDGGKADLRDALRIAPQYAPAAAVLFDACLADGEHRDARSALAVLQEHAGGPEILVKQMQFAARTGDEDAAVRTLRDIAEAPADGPPVVLQLVLAEMESAGWGDRAALVLKESWQAGGGEFNPWAPLFWLDTPDGAAADDDDRLAAVNAALESHPTFAPGYDRKAELLAQMSRYDEAAAACLHPGAGDPPPVTLRGRLAWVEARRGDRAKAVSIMKRVLIDDPGYAWGWRNLAQWYDADDRHADCLGAAEHMVRLNPDDPLSYGYRGEARRALGDKAGAKEDFRRAFELDPAFDAAGLHLISAQLDADEVEAAARTLAVLQEHAVGPVLKFRAVQVAAKQGNLTLARSRLRGLAADPLAIRIVIRDAAAALDAAGWAAEADDELLAYAAGDSPLPAAVGVWADRRTKAADGADVLDRVPELLAKNPDAGREAILSFAAATAAAGRTALVGATVHRFADALRADTASWSRAGAALAAAGSYALAASWLADWQGRDDVDAGTLRPLADSLRALDRDRDALAVATAAATRGGPPAAVAVARAWLALDAAVNANPAAAAELIRKIDQIGLDDGTKLVVAMAEAVVMVAHAGPDGRKLAYVEAKEHLKAAAGACAAADIPPGAARWYQRTVAAVAAASGLLTAKAWAAWQRMRPLVG